MKDSRVEAMLQLNCIDEIDSDGKCVCLRLQPSVGTECGFSYPHTEEVASIHQSSGSCISSPLFVVGTGAASILVGPFC